ncbi:hypothetical protein FQA39_LY04107 [Lamprigera yunnana]|nr:hypothetical protein FQA39_LY04107 [Lamprigera yunnana]
MTEMTWVGHNTHTIVTLEIAVQRFWQSHLTKPCLDSETTSAALLILISVSGVTSGGVFGIVSAVIFFFFNLQDNEKKILVEEEEVFCSFFGKIGFAAGVEDLAEDVGVSIEDWVGLVGRREGFPDWCSRGLFDDCGSWC